MTSRRPRPPWRDTLAPFATPSLGRGLLAVTTSAVPYLALTATIYATLGVSLALTVALTILAAGYLVRVFVAFHDCAHGSLLPSRRANTMLGTAMGVLVLSPFVRWRHDHAVHHATAGDLDRRGVGDIVTLTVDEYAARSWRGRVGYRLLRNPLVMFGLGPVIAMVIGPRIVARGAKPRMRNSVLATDAAIVVLVGGLCWLIGWGDFLLVWAPAALLAGSVGIWLFYVQHQFEDTYWQRRESGPTPTPCCAGARTCSFRPCCSSLRGISGCTMSTTSTHASPTTTSSGRTNPAPCSPAFRP
jgi:omega-6 fatty acid desaturase (delta-12 desaturase)